MLGQLKRITGLDNISGDMVELEPGLCNIFQKEKIRRFVALRMEQIEKR